MNPPALDPRSADWAIRSGRLERGWLLLSENGGSFGGSATSVSGAAGSRQGRGREQALRWLLKCPRGLALDSATEHLLRALLLQILYSVRSERLLMEQLNYHLLFRWFVGLKADARIWDATVFTKNPQRLLDDDIAPGLLRPRGGRGPGTWAVVGRALQRGWHADRGLGQFQELQAPRAPANPTG